mmetsp:Transcript_8216/g.33266  ORF Transcript_8216/g.33266 Transcript_8216/m.33266 type:complete len:285 (+) Transcript_8216:869-1723(+)
MCSTRPRSRTASRCSPSSRRIRQGSRRAAAPRPRARRPPRATTSPARLRWSACRRGRATRTARCSRSTSRSSWAMRTCAWGCSTASAPLRTPWATRTSPQCTALSTLCRPPDDAGTRAATSCPRRPTLGWVPSAAGWNRGRVGPWIGCALATAPTASRRCCPRGSATSASTDTRSTASTAARHWPRWATPSPPAALQRRHRSLWAPRSACWAWSASVRWRWRSAAPSSSRRRRLLTRHTSSKAALLAVDIRCSACGRPARALASLARPWQSSEDGSRPVGVLKV